MPSLSLNIFSDPVVNTFCPIANKDWQYLVSLLHASLNGDPNFNYGNATPPPDKRGLPWYRLNGDGSPDKWYSFNQGLWLSPHTLPPGFVGIFTGAQADIPAFDGGNTNAISATDGAFWQELTAAQGRFIVGAGTTPAPDSTLLTVGQTGGEEKHALTIDENAPHTHFLASDVTTNPKVTLTVANHVAKESNFDGAGSPFSYSLSGTATDATLGISGESGGAGGPPAVVGRHNNMPPYLVATFIMRTARLYFTQPA